MAIIDEVKNEFVQTSLLSKVQVSGTVYYLKDAEVREVLGKLTKAAFTELSNGKVDASDVGLVTGAQVAEAIKGLAGAMHFVGSKNDVPTDNTGYKAGDVILVGVKEYVFDGSDWKELGDEGLYVAKTTTIAGIDLQNNITAEELANALSNQLKTSLELGALAYADTASGTGKVETIDSISLATLTVAGNAKVTSSDATVSSSGEYTPTGTITINGNVVSGATFVESTDESDRDAIVIKGTVSAPSITVTPTAKTITHEVVENKGTPATWTGATYTAPSLGAASKSQFATNGVVANMSESDHEMLVFTSAATSDALTAQGSFEAGSVDFGTFNGGSMPTYKKFTETVLGSVTAELSSAPQFTGSKYKVSTSSAANDLTADFVGTQATLSVSGTYKKADATAAYSVDVVPAVSTITRTEKTVSVKVSPDAKVKA